MLRPAQYSLTEHFPVYRAKLPGRTGLVQDQQVTGDLESLMKQSGLCLRQFFSLCLRHLEEEPISSRPRVYSGPQPL